jgi:F420-non-reducing hydrogenase iron-sulfur subunit
MSANAKVKKMEGQESSGGWQPTIAAFFCNWCTYTAADLAGVSRLKYSPNVRVIRLMCSGRVDPQFILDAFAKGADGVLVGGCHPGDCHYAEGNYKALRRFEMLKRLTAGMGIEPERLRLEWISASEGDKVRTVINDMVEQVRRLGPLKLTGHDCRDLAALKKGEPHSKPMSPATPASDQGEPDGLARPGAACSCANVATLRGSAGGRPAIS